MSDDIEIEEFSNNHPHPDDIGLTSLYKFFRINSDRIEYLNDLLIDGKLYHATPDQFNDPFECKPNFNWPEISEKVKEIRKHLIKVARNNGHSRKSAETTIAKNMSKPGYIHNLITESAHRAFKEVRICSFTTRKENLLFWSHYAESHKGFCVEFNATKLPIRYAFKVKYVEDYPEIEYPAAENATGLKPLLMKSKEWDYEEEFRTMLVSSATKQPKNDGKSLILNGDEIKSIFLGVNMSDENKEKVIDTIRKGPFNPVICCASLSKTSFKLEFNEC